MTRSQGEPTASAAEATKQHQERSSVAGGPGGMRDAEQEAGAEEAVHGRIGYGRYARYTPLVFALLLLGTLAVIEFGWPAAPGSTVRPAELAGKSAPDVTLTLLDGSALRLSDLRGSVVVLNFWASWCEPCREEMPLLQAESEAATARGEPVAIVGVGVRTDRDADVRALVAELGLTYPIGRDTATEAAGRGPIELAFGVPQAYPSTIFVRPDGTVDRFHLGPLTAEQLRLAIAEAAR
jgi:cytochrome c biogenesis protein CcmG/thiol:disulfide interchange protein DsbE